MRSLRTISTCLILALTGVGCAQDADVAASNSAGGSGNDPGFKLARSEVVADETPDISDADYAAFISSANDFGLELMQEVASTGALDKTKNGVFSPVSALLALAMTYGGAEEKMADAMKLALHDELAAGQYHVAQNRLLRELQAYNYEGKNTNGETVRVEVKPANSLWVARDLAFKTPFLDLMSQQYDTGVYLVDFPGAPDQARLAINGWVEDKTHDKIRELLKAGDVDTDTAVVLVNALYLFANWEVLFDKSVTNDATFTTLAGDSAAVSMMRQTEQLRYKDLGDSQVVTVPYVNGDLHLTVVLPDEGQFETVRQSVSADWLATATADLVESKVALGLPKFVIETEQIKLMAALRNLGLFDGGDAITGITESSLVIGDVIQKAYIGTNEAGTEAAAATAVILYRGTSETPVVFSCERPFLYFIQAKNGLVLFAGQVTDPTATN